MPLCALAAPASAWCASGLNGISAWTAAPDQAGPALKAQTIRQVVRTSVGGARVRLRLSNLYGHAPVTFGAVHVGQQASGAAIVAGSGHALRFGGKTAVTVSIGQSILSGPVEMAVAPLQPLAVSMDQPDGKGAATLHGTELQSAYLAQAGDAAAAIAFPAGISRTPTPATPTCNRCCRSRADRLATVRLRPEDLQTLARTKTLINRIEAAIRAHPQHTA